MPAIRATRSKGLGCIRDCCAGCHYHWKEKGVRRVGLFDKLTGRTKKAAGDLTDNPSLRREGRQEERKGQAKEELSRTEEAAERKAEEIGNL